MATPITEISGVGEHTAVILRDHGYTHAEDLATTTEDALSNVPGFGPARAKQIINAAKALCNTDSRTGDVFTDLSLTGPAISTIDDDLDDLKVEVSAVINSPADKKSTKKKKTKKGKKDSKKDKNKPGKKDKKDKDGSKKEKSKKKAKKNKKSARSETKKTKKKKMN